MAPIIYEKVAWRTRFSTVWGEGGGPAVATHSWNLRAQETEATGLEISGHLRLHSEILCQNELGRDKEGRGGFQRAWGLGAQPGMPVGQRDADG